MRIFIRSQGDTDATNSAKQSGRDNPIIPEAAYGEMRSTILRATGTISGRGEGENGTSNLEGVTWLTIRDDISNNPYGNLGNIETNMGPGGGGVYRHSVEISAGTRYVNRPVGRRVSIGRRRNSRFRNRRR